MAKAVAVVATVAAALLLAGGAQAAPPPNDDRANAAPIPTFPATIQGTTAEATVERLDPQVSQCGRIESTVWYRIDQAPDGTIVAFATTRPSKEFSVETLGIACPAGHVTRYPRNP